MKKILFIIAFVLLTIPLVKAAYVSLSVSSRTVPTTIEPGEQANIILTITNNGNDYARNVKLKLKSHTFIKPTTNSYDLQTIAPSNSIQVTIPIVVSSDASEGTTALFFTIDYNEGAVSGTTTVENSISLSITRRALIEIVDVNYDKELVQPGDNVKMSIELKNVGRGRAKDLIVSLPNASLPFVPAAADTEVYLKNLEPNEIKTANFSLIIKKNAETIGYSIPVAFTYYDELSSSNSEQKYVGMKISGKPDFIVNVESLERMYAGAIGEITISIANRGTANAEFLSVRFDSQFDVTPREYYVGTLEPDEYETVTVDINLGSVQMGKHTMNIDLLYKDPYNQEFSKKMIVDFTVGAMPSGISATTIIIIFVAIIVIVYWKRKFFIRIIFRRK